MKFLQKTWVAVVITAAMIVAAVAIGLSKPAPAATPEPAAPPTFSDTALDGSLSTGQYQRYLNDQPGVLTEQQRQQISLYNANWDLRYSSILVVDIQSAAPTSDSLADYAYDQANRMELGRYDAYLVIVPSIQDAYFAAGTDYPLSDSQITDFMDRYLYQDLVDGKTGQGVLALCAGLNDYYVSNFGTGSADGDYSYDDYGTDEASSGGPADAAGHSAGDLQHHRPPALLLLSSAILRCGRSARYLPAPAVLARTLLRLVSPPLAPASSPASPGPRRPRSQAARRSRQLWRRS